MWIYACNIQWFRGIRDLWVFPNPAVNVLVGSNNTFKTTVLDACRLCLEPSVNWRRDDILGRFDFHFGDTSQEIQMGIWLHPGKDDDAEVQDRFYDRLSKWRTLKERNAPSGGKAEEDVARDADGLPTEAPTRLNAQPTDPMESSSSPTSDLLAIRMVGRWDGTRQLADGELFITDEMGAEIKPLTFEDRQVLGFRFFPARRDPVYQLSMARQSILSRLLKDEELGQELRKLLDLLENNRSGLLSLSSVTQVLTQLQKLLPSALRAEKRIGADFTLTFLDAEVGQLRSATRVATKVSSSSGQSVELPLTYQGDGVQNLILLLHLAGLAGAGAVNNLIGLEEPEQNLEPQLARWVFGQLCREIGSAASGRNQLFVSTHSPNLVAELYGAGSIVKFATTPGSQPRVIVGSRLSQESRKRFERNRLEFCQALFARQVMLVEGPSEEGSLPVAFQWLGTQTPEKDPRHLGIEVYSTEGKGEKMKELAKYLSEFGCECHVLLDNDYSEKEVKSLEAELEEFRKVSRFVTCWSKKSLLAFAKGCDMEIILVYQTPPAILCKAMKEVYADAGHPLDESQWQNAIQVIQDAKLRDEMPKPFPSPLNEFDIGSLKTDEAQRAFLLAALHGPHSFKSTKDMRLLIQLLGEASAIPEAFLRLAERILHTITDPGSAPAIHFVVAS